MSISSRTDWLFHGDSGNSRQDVIRWWERRRLSYNLAVGVVGIVTWLLVEVAGSAAVKPGTDFEEPIAMIFGPVLYGLMANLFYTCGWIRDLALHRSSPSKRVFKAGLIFSLVLTALPGLWAVVAWLFTVISGRKLD